MAFTLSLLSVAVSGSESTQGISNVIDWTMNAAPSNVPVVQENIKFRLGASSLANLRTTIRTINHLINDINYRFEHHAGSRLYLEFNADGTAGQTYRSEILNAVPIPDSGLLQKYQLGAAKFLVFTLTLMRKNYWENSALTTATITAYNYHVPTISQWRLYNSYDDTAVAAGVIDATANGIKESFSGTLANIPLQFNTTPDYFVVGYTIAGTPYTANADVAGNLTGTSLTSGTINTITGAWTLVFSTAPDNATNITATYHYGYSNSFTIAGAQVIGDLPTPLVLTLKNNYTVAGNGYSEYFVGLSQLTTSDTMPWFFEAEDSTGSTSTSDTSCSGGYRGDYALASDTEALMYDWTLTSAQVTALGGRMYKIIGRWSSEAVDADITNIKYRWKIEATGNRLMWQGDQIQLDSSVSRVIWDLGVVQIPPWTIPDAQTPYGLHLVLYGQRLSGTTPTCSLDYITLLPLDSYRKIEFAGEPVAGGFELVYDGNGDLTEYQVDDNGGGTDGQHYGNVLSYGSGLMLLPNRNHRLVLVVAQSGNYEAPFDAHNNIVSVRYRPRVVSL